MAELSFVLRNNIQYTNCRDTLKETSKDTENNEYLCQSSMEVYDFDCIVKKLYPQKQPASYDSLIIDEKKKIVYCVEFKNQVPSQINNANIKKKLTNGRDVLNNICTNENVQKKNYKFIYCVIHKPAHNRYGNPLVDRETKFELKAYTDTHFDKIVTNDINFFKNEFRKEFKEEGC
ncbi:MAG: Unknown protein [uncultured Sulfurovum sp.]|uniref:Uncharacterized protein n=1 Tax=uncultured Sulfurovum sp. TaxID=269237 RepID=A0A6S6TPM1_9BACT|nr:MAG: Unknown protein [uncultured Sulfurovum sp.]